MKHIFTSTIALALLLFGVQPLQAQKPFPTSADQAQWGVEIIGIGMFFPIVQRIQYAADTTIGGQAYTRYQGLQFYTTTTLPSQPFSFLIRTDRQRVYQRTDNRDRLLYDFSLIPGDSVWLPSFGDSTGVDSVHATIDSITTIQSAGTSRRLFHLSYPTRDFMGGTYRWRTWWVEGVGSTEGPAYRLDTSWGPATDNDYPHLVCFQENNSLAYLAQGNTACQAILATDEPVQSRPQVVLSGVFPNPAQGEVVLEYELPEAGAVSITVSDLLGRQRFVQQLQHQSAGEYRLQLPELSSGVYFVVVKAAGQRQLLRYIQE